MKKYSLLIVFAITALQCGQIQKHMSPAPACDSYLKQKYNTFFGWRYSRQNWNKIKPQYLECLAKEFVNELENFAKFKNYGLEEEANKHKENAKNIILYLKSFYAPEDSYDLKGKKNLDLWLTPLYLPLAKLLFKLQKSIKEISKRANNNRYELEILNKENTTLKQIIDFLTTIFAQINLDWITKLLEYVEAWLGATLSSGEEARLAGQDLLDQSLLTFLKSKFDGLWSLHELNCSQVTTENRDYCKNLLEEINSLGLKIDKLKLTL